MKYKNIIFDLDGTLLDTLQDLTAATNYAMREHHFPEHTLEEVRWFVGNGIKKLIERAVPAGTSAEEQAAVLATFSTYYKAHSNDKTAAYPGIMALLDKLREHGCKTAIVSNKADFAVQDLAQLYFAGRMDAASGEREGIAKKPAPDMVYSVMHTMQADAAATVYVGDSDTDLETARNAGLPCIGVCWGFRGREFLLEHGATMLAETPEEVWQLCSGEMEA